MRTILPALGFTTVIALANLAPLPAQASKVNNCGVKGGYAYGGYSFAFHDHGKPCPNRPFPGKGKGIQKFLNVGTAAPTTTGNRPSIEDETTTSQGNTEPRSKGKGHTGGKGHGLG